LPHKRFPQARPFLALGIVVVAWAILPVVVKSLARISFYEFQAPANLTAERIRALQVFWSSRLHSKNDMFEAGKDVARLNAAYELSIREKESLDAEVDRLELLLNLPARDGYRYEIARVVSREFSAWWQQVTIRKGHNYGIPVGAPVVFTGGVVGRVREVHTYTAVVDLLSSQNLRLAANFDGDNRPVAYRGGPNPAFVGPRGTVEFVPMDLTTSENDRPLLVTSGLGGVFPPGLPIGRVDHLEPGPDGQFLIGEVVLDGRMGSLTEVAVLIPITGE
jgi:rod shape-determining protein MreC